jgi:hypothetical protein
MEPDPVGFRGLPLMTIPKTGLQKQDSRIYQDLIYRAFSFATSASA